MLRLSDNDKKIWRETYDKEYSGLKNLPVWKTITKSEYLKIRKIVGHTLPTMAISTVKYDEDNNPNVPNGALWPSAT